MVERLKTMGLPPVQRSKVMETFHDAGEAEALEQAEGYLTSSRNEIANAKAAAKLLCGMEL